MEILKLSCIINENKLNTNLFENEEYKGNGTCAFINMSAICNHLNITVTFENDQIVLYNDINKMIIDYKSKNMHTYIYRNNEFINKQGWYKNMIEIIGNEYYIVFCILLRLINGSLKQTEDEIILYTYDYERMDIPITLEECFEYLDKNLDLKRKEGIKLNGNLHEHFGVCLWIRNNWLYPNNIRKDKLLKNLNIFFLEPDSLSNEIIDEYHKYLNGKNIAECNINTMYGTLLNGKYHAEDT